VKGAQLDGVTVIVPDFIDDLRVVGTDVLEVLEHHGVNTHARAYQKSMTAS
jgi:hypothetical protein